MQQHSQAARGKEDRAHRSWTVREGVSVEQRGRRNEVVGGGTGTDCSLQRQDAGVTQARDLDMSRASKIITGRLLWKPKEEGGKMKAIGVGETRVMQMRPGDMYNNVRAKARQRW